MGRSLDILYAAGAALTAPVWAANMLRTGKWRTDWRGRFGRGERVASDGPRLLIHAVSVGEVNATRSLVALLRERRPDVTVVLSATTNTGCARATQLYGDELTVVRFPFDFTGSVKRFLDRVRPDAVALMELEVWPNFMQQCDRRGVPVCVINGRLTERSYRRYQRAGPLVYRAFRQLTAAGVQTEAYAQRFRGLGVPADRVRVLDTMKWDTAQIADTIDGADELARDMGIDRTKPLIVAGSTGPGEEKLLLDTRPDGAQLLIAPRKPERFDEVAALAPDMVRRTQSGGRRPGTGPAESGSAAGLFLLDTIGELRAAYSLADVVIVGRSFLGLYGSDAMEPAALGKPVIIGPHYADFQETVDAMRDAGGLIVTPTPMAEASRLLADRPAAQRLADAGRAVIRSRQGATRRYADLLLEHLPART